MLKNSKNTQIGTLVLGILFIFVVFVFITPRIFSMSYVSTSESEKKVEIADSVEQIQEEVEIGEELTPISHIETPTEAKALYISSWAAGTSKFTDRIIGIIDETEANAVVIDIKDYTGKISFEVQDEELKSYNSVEKRIPDIRALTNRLHAKGIYVIGRVSVFQDPHFIKKFPETAVRTKTNKDAVWKDKKGISWIDAGSKEAWDYTIKIAEESYNAGFDEINFDYIRFPSDGNMTDIYFPYSEGKDKSEVLESFFIYLHENLKDSGFKTSADLFGLTTTIRDDMGIGQVLEKTLPYFDYVCPMVYPSHFPSKWNGFAKPATKPYEVIKITMDKATERAEAMGLPASKIRPWLQDFDLGADYNKDMVRAQIQATYDAGLNSWMLWDPKNIYTKEALEREL
jgi:hypothetical protein